MGQTLIIMEEGDHMKEETILKKIMVPIYTTMELINRMTMMEMGHTAKMEIMDRKNMEITIMMIPIIEEMGQIMVNQVIKI